MSLRMLKKLQQQKQESDIHVDSDSDVDSGFSEKSRNPSSNIFGLLDVQEEVEDENGSEDNQTNNQEESTDNSSFTQKYAKKNDNKKKKKKGKSANVTGKDTSFPLLDGLSLEDSASSSYNANRNTKTSVPAKSVQSSLKETHSTYSLLSVDRKYLKAEDELRRIFGSKVVNANVDNNSKGGQRRTHGLRHGGHIFHLKKSILVTPLDHWPRWDGCMSMDLVESKDGLQFFRYTRSSSYMVAQRHFEEAQSIHDLNAIVAVLHRHPYHVESLLVLADAFKYAGEHDRCVDLIEKCLYALECAWHPSFNHTRGTCRLYYNDDANKPFFIALQKHVQNLDRRGCFRSALEVCKMLLSLNSDDPLGALFYIDYFALRSQQYEWLETFADQYASDYSLCLLPNFSFSLAVARFYRENDVSEASTASGSNASSLELLKQALMLHPLVLKKLVDKTPLKEAVWQEILKSRYFSKAEAGSPSLDHLIQIYVERNYLIWRLPELQKLLKDAAFQVIDAVRQDKSEVKDWACVRKETFTSDKNEYAHLLVSDYSDSIPSIPPEEVQHLIAGGPGGHVNQNAAIVHDQQRGPANIAGRNGLIVFLESLLPWVDLGVNGNVIEHREHQNPDEDHQG